MLFDKVKELADAKGYSIYRLEKEAKLSSGSICKWNSASPSVSNLKKVANILKCSIDDLAKEGT
ncbi:MAG: helix-turn-helix domain-containing protein [Lachnospiraceae bacterium]